MKTPKLILKTLAVMLLAITASQANVLVSHGGTSLSMYSDSGTLLLDYSTTLTSAKDVVTDGTHVYVSDFSATSVGEIKMYDIATGAFIRNVLSDTQYSPLGLAYNPSNSGEIIAILPTVTGAAGTHFARLDTSATNTFVVTSELFGEGYTGAFYTGSLDKLYASHPAAGGLIQKFLPDTLVFDDNVSVGGLPDPRGITQVGSEFFYTSDVATTGLVQRQPTPTDIITGLDNPNGITTDGTDLWVARFGDDLVSKYETDGTFLSSFAVTGATGIAYTTVPEPTPLVLLGLGMGVVVLVRRRARKVS